MSDGNFNRALLPHTPYQSGLKAGKSMGKMFAVEAFKEYLLQSRPNITDEELKQQTEIFQALLSHKG